MLRQLKYNWSAIRRASSSRAPWTTLRINWDSQEIWMILRRNFSVRLSSTRPMACVKTLNVKSTPLGSYWVITIKWSSTPQLPTQPNALQRIPRKWILYFWLPEMRAVMTMTIRRLWNCYHDRPWIIYRSNKYRKVCNEWVIIHNSNNLCTWGTQEIPNSRHRKTKAISL